MILDEQLCREHALPIPADCQVDVRRPEDADQGVRDRLDGTEIVLALRVSQEAAVALEVRIVAGWLAPFGVHDDAVLSTCQIDERVSDWLSSHRQHTARQMRDLADRRCNRIVDNQQIVVRVQGHLVGIEGTFARRCGGLQLQRFREQPASRERASPAARLAGTHAAPKTDYSSAWLCILTPRERDRHLRLYRRGRARKESTVGLLDHSPDALDVLLADWTGHIRGHTLREVHPAATRAARAIRRPERVQPLIRCERRKVDDPDISIGIGHAGVLRDCVDDNHDGGDDSRPHEGPRCHSSLPLAPLVPAGRFLHDISVLDVLEWTSPVASIAAGATVSWMTTASVSPRIE